MGKLNESLNRVQVGRHKEVPIETNSNLWFLWIKTNGDWDAEAITRWKTILEIWEGNKPTLIFCVWHGNYRTNLFLMDQEDLIKRLNKFTKK